MSFLPQRHTAEPAGDFVRRRARFVLLLFMVLLPITIWLFARLEQIWLLVLPLKGSVFLILSALLGTVLAVAPIATLVFFLMAVWFGVQSIALERSRSTPLLDRAIIAVGLVTWFAPALALASKALSAILAGSISFTRPQREYLLASDPIAFWQSIGFLLIVAAALAYPSWHYWRGKFGEFSQKT